MQCARSNKDGNTVLGDVRESGITGLPLAGWKSKSLFIWSNDFFSYFYSRFRDDNKAMQFFAATGKE